MRGVSAPWRVRFIVYRGHPTDDGCIPWLAGKFTDGYGTPWDEERGRMVGAHRLAWELEHGAPPPKGRVVMHTCDHPWCVNPGHLRLGTVAENNRDRAAKRRSARTLSKTHCPKGHEYTESNVYRRPPSHTGVQKIRCRECVRISNRLRSQRPL